MRCRPAHSAHLKPKNLQCPPHCSCHRNTQAWPQCTHITTFPQAAAAAPATETPPAAAGGTITAAQVKELRAKSGAGMMDCKKALTAAGGDLTAAAEALRAKGLASADKKASRVAAEGKVVSYIHSGARLGVIVEVNCETDFVARGDAFTEFANDVALQVAANGDLKVVSKEDVSAEMIAQEREAELQKEDLQSKPEDIRAKIVEGRLEKLKAQQVRASAPFHVHARRDCRSPPGRGASQHVFLPQGT